MSQSHFQKVIGGSGDDRGRTINKTSDGGFIITGSSNSFGSGGHNTYLLRTDGAGAILWSKSIGGSLQDEGKGVMQTSDGGFIIVGATYSFGAGNRDFYVIKTNNSGDVVWSKTYGGTGDDYGFIIQETNDNCFAMIGHTNSYGNGGNDVYFIKINSTGDILWSRTYGGPGDDRGFSMEQTNDGGFIISGYTTSFGAGDADVYAIKTDINGNVIWSGTFGGAGEDQAYSVKQTIDGGYIFTGYSNFGSSPEIYIIKTDSPGNMVWSKTFGGAGDDVGNIVYQNNAGDYFIAGYQDSFGAGGYDAFLMKLNDSGNLYYFKTFGGVNDDFGITGCLVDDGGFIVSGFTRSFGAGSYDVYIIKTDNEGQSGCNQYDPAVITQTIPPSETNSGLLVGTGGLSINVISAVASASPIVNSLCVALPVEYLFFNGVKDSGKVILKWKTLSEINNKMFTVERSRDGIHFFELDHVIGESNNNGNTYKYVDQFPLDEIGYYRLRQIDNNGSFSYSNIISIEMAGSILESLYPNPAKDFLSIQLRSQNISDVNINVLDLSGRKVDSIYPIPVENGDLIRFSVAKYGSGFYYLEIIDGKDGSYHLEKFIVMKD